MNLVARQNFAHKASIGTNTTIGGVASTISTPALLATKLGIDVSRISNFSIVGSDIKCKITGNYAIPAAAFSTYGGNFPNTLTYYNDTDNLCTYIGHSAFYIQTNFSNFTLNAVTTIDYNAFTNTRAKEYYLPAVTSLLNYQHFSDCSNSEVFYLPLCTVYGTSPSVNNGVFSNIKSGFKIYAHPSTATNNSTGVDADLAYAISQGASVRYVTNFTAPLTPTLTSIGTIYNTAVQLNFTPPIGSTNTIDYYEVYANGVFKNRITGSGGYIIGLTPSTNYNITIKAVDVFYNKSTVSNSVNASTNTTFYFNLDKLVAVYNMDETTGSTLSDPFASKNLTVSGVLINQTGKINNSVASNGLGDSAFASTFPSIAGNFSINMWCYRTGTNSANDGIIDIGSYGLNNGFGLWMNASGQVSYRINQLNINNYTGCPTLPLNTWQMVTIVYDGKNVKTYIDGVLSKTVAHTVNPTANNSIRIFNRADAVSQPYKGKLDIISVFNGALTQQDIDGHYNSGAGRQF